MINWREVLGYRGNVPSLRALRGYENGDPPYNQDPDFDPEGHLHVYKIPYSEDAFGTFLMTGRCKREAEERYNNGLEDPSELGQDSNDNFLSHWDQAEDLGRA
jgi:hypothetical protein